MNYLKLLICKLRDNKLFSTVLVGLALSSFNIAEISACQVTPTVNFMASDSVIIQGDTVTFTDQSTGDPTTWVWTVSPSTGVTFVDGTSSGSKDPKIQFDNEGVYSITLDASNSSGSGTLTKTAYIKVCPVGGCEPVAIYSASSTNVCAGSTVNFTDHSTGPVTQWYWSFDGGSPANSTIGSPSVEYSAPGTYSAMLVVSNDNGQDTLTTSITVNAIPTVSLIASPASVCSGSSTSLSAIGATTYTWQPATGLSASNIPNPTATISSSITYTVNGTSNGCSNTSTITVYVNPLPATPSISVSGGNVLTSNASTGNQWYKNGVIISGATAQSITLTTSGNYTVKVTDSNGCTSLPSTPYSYGISGIEEENDVNSINVYPNPTNGTFMIEADIKQSDKPMIVLYNLIGETVKTIEYSTAANGVYKKEVNVKELPSGVYFLSLRTSQGVSMKKIIKN